MSKKIRFIVGACIMCLVMSQMTGCIPSKKLVKFTGHWITKKDPFDETKTIRSCVEGGYQCAVLGTGIEVELTDDLIKQMIQ